LQAIPGGAISAETREWKKIAVRTAPCHSRRAFLADGIRPKSLAERGAAMDDIASRV
jgi:hypothetical protein